MVLPSLCASSPPVMPPLGLLFAIRRGPACYPALSLTCPRLAPQTGALLCPSGSQPAMPTLTPELSHDLAPVPPPTHPAMRHCTPLPSVPFLGSPTRSSGPRAASSPWKEVPECPSWAVLPWASACVTPSHGPHHTEWLLSASVPVSPTRLGASGGCMSCSLL